ncbi:MAG: TonB-dependent receptor [Gammaproteobacteria bacterium]
MLRAPATPHLANLLLILCVAWHLPRGAAADPPRQAAAVAEEIVVIGERTAPRAAAGPTTTLAGEQLRGRVGATLGATLDAELGVHNASFGPGVGIPVIRGLTGTRVRMLHNGVGTHDAAASSPDHAVALEPLLAEEIRVVRGAETIRYGSSAIGGTVEVRDNRIPERAVAQPIAGAVELRHDRNPVAHAGAFKVDAGAGFLAAHVDGYWRDSNLVDIPGAALNAAAVRDEFGEGVEFEQTVGRLANSDLEARGGAVGAALVGAAGFAGISVATAQNNYGIPPGGLPPHSDSPGQLPAVQRIRIDIEQGRQDFRFALNAPLTGIERVAAQLARVEYRHHESDNGNVSTVFRNEVLEARTELEHRLHPRLPGTLGAQWVDRDFGAVGFETFVPPSTIRTLGIFALQRVEFDHATLTAGIRRETVRTRPRETVRSGIGAIDVALPARLAHDAHSASLALALQPWTGLELRIGFDHAERAPDVQELLALGPHLSTRSFDIGNPALDNERGNMLDAGLRWSRAWFALELDVYWRRIDDYVFLANQGIVYDVEDAVFRAACVRLDRCVSVFGYTQQDALFNGFEARVVGHWRLGPGELAVEAFGDTVRGYFAAASAGDVPRLPPSSFGLALAFDAERWRAGTRLTRGMAQRRAGRNESPTAAYLQLNADLGVRLPFAGTTRAFAFLRANNLLDDEIRNATSFLRNFMPEPGRSVEIALRLEF